jgi:hypothetical protein
MQAEQTNYFCSSYHAHVKRTSLITGTNCKKIVLVRYIFANRSSQVQICESCSSQVQQKL